jgi:hypothetical protein
LKVRFDAIRSYSPRRSALPNNILLFQFKESKTATNFIFNGVPIRFVGCMLAAFPAIQVDTYPKPMFQQAAKVGLSLAQMARFVAASIGPWHQTPGFDGLVYLFFRRKKAVRRLLR